LINIGTLKENLDFLKKAKELALRNLASDPNQVLKLCEKSGKDKDFNLNLNVNFNFNILPEDADCI
jgi:hypothetical protein